MAERGEGDQTSRLSRAWVVSYPPDRLEFVIVGAIAFAFSLYTFLVWRERRAERLRLAPPGGKMSAYRGAMPDAKKLDASAPFVVNAAALGTFAFVFLTPVELLVDRVAAFIARGMSRRGAAPAAFVPSWRAGLWLLRHDARAENAVDRLHRLQVLVNLFLMVALALSASSLASHPFLLVALGGLLLVRALHTRLLGKVAKAFDPAAQRLAGPSEQHRVDGKKDEDVPPWLSRALTRRAENRLGATPLGSARPLPPERRAVRVGGTVSVQTTPISMEATEPEEDADEAGEASAEPLAKGRRTIG